MTVYPEIRLCFDLLFETLTRVSDKSKLEVFLYGGFLRDSYLGYVPNDLDVGIVVKNKDSFYTLMKEVANEYFTNKQIKFYIGDVSSKGFSIGLESKKLLDIHFIDKRRFFKLFFRTVDFTINSLIIKIFPSKHINYINLIELFSYPGNRELKKIIIHETRRIMPRRLWNLAIHDLEHKILRVNPYLDFKLNDRFAARLAKFIERGLEYDPEANRFIENGFKIDKQTLSIAMKQSLLMKISQEVKDKRLIKRMIKDKHVEQVFNYILSYNSERINYDLFNILMGNASWSKIDSDERFYYVIKFINEQTHYFTHFFNGQVNVERLKYLNTKGLNLVDRAMLRYLVLTFPIDKMNLNPLLLFDEFYSKNLLEKSNMLKKDFKKNFALIIFFFILTLHYYIIFIYQVKKMTKIFAFESIYNDLNEFIKRYEELKLNHKYVAKFLMGHSKQLIRFYISVLYAIYKSEGTQFINSNSFFNEYRKFIEELILYLKIFRLNLEKMIMGLLKKKNVKWNLNSELSINEIKSITINQLMNENIRIKEIKKYAMKIINNIITERTLQRAS